MSELGLALDRAEIEMREEPIARTSELVAMLLEERYRPGRHTAGRGTWLAVAATVLVLAVSPPGQDAISWAADAIVGDQPTDELDIGDNSREAVIGAGETPNGVQYEVVGSTAVSPLAPEHGRFACLRVDLLDTTGPQSLTCATGILAGSSSAGAVEARATLAPADLGSDRLLIQGSASANVARAEVESVGANGSVTRYPAQIFTLDTELAKSLQMPASVSFILAFLPENLVPPRPAIVPSEAPGASAQDPRTTLEMQRAREALRLLSVVAYDAANREIGRVSLAGPNAEIGLYPPSE
jgi:hypothetical protein